MGSMAHFSSSEVIPCEPAARPSLSFTLAERTSETEGGCISTAGSGERSHVAKLSTRIRRWKVQSRREVILPPLMQVSLHDLPRGRARRPDRLVDGCASLTCPSARQTLYNAVCWVKAMLTQSSFGITWESIIVRITV